MSQEAAETLSLVVQLFGLFITVIIAFFCKKKTAVISGIVTMFIANIVGQILIAGGGPGAFAGIILLPVLGGFTAYIVVTIKGVALKRQKAVRRNPNGVNRRGWN
jgi:uncharacterized membrane protein